MLERTISKSIRSYCDDFKVILATGARQVGKTTLLRMMKEDGRDYVTLDNSQDREIAINDPEAFFMLHPVPCMIDEVQRAPGLFLKIKELVDSSERNNQIWLTGSQKPRLMRNIGDTLSGRVVEVDVYPLSQAEKQADPFRQPFFPVFDGEIDAPWDYAETIENILMGGYPALMSMKRENRNAWFRSYISTYLLGDIRYEGESMDEATFLKILRILAARTGSAVNYTSIAEDAGISAYKVKMVMNLLVSYRIIYLLEPYSGNTLKSLVRTPRMYFTDSGLCCYLLGISNASAFLSHPLAGFIFESYAIGELIRNARNNGDDSEFYFYREEGKRHKDDDRSVREIDLVKKTGDRLYPFEIKLNATPTLSMARNFSALPSSEMGTIVCMSRRKTILSKDVLVMPVSMI